MLSIYLGAPAFYDLNIPRAWMYWTFNRRRRALLATVDGRGAFVLQTQLRDGEEAETMTDAEAGDLFLQAVGREIPFRVTGIASWLAQLWMKDDDTCEVEITEIGTLSNPIRDEARPALARSA